MSNIPFKMDDVIETAFQAMINSMDIDHAQRFKTSQDGLSTSMHMYVHMNSLEKPQPLMGSIGDIRIGNITINIVAIISLLLGELAKIFGGYDIHVVIAGAVFVCSLINSIKTNEQVKLNETDAIVYCTILQLIGGPDKDPAMIPRQMLMDRMRENNQDIDINKSLLSLKDKKLIWLNRTQIIVSKILIIE